MKLDFLKKVSKKTYIKLAIYLSIVIGGFALDRISKVLVANNLKLGVLSQIEIIPNFLYFAYVRNTGGAWSILSNATWLLAIISVAAVVGITYYLFTNKPNLHYFIAMSFIVSGGAGNLFDRIFYGSVIDFVETYPFGYSFPIFNVADIFVVCGAFYLIIYMLFEEHLNKSEAQKKILTVQELRKKDDEGCKK